MDISRFELLDRCLALDTEAGAATFEAQTPWEGPLFQGHFPGRPLLPGVLQLEIIGQAAGLLVMCRRQLADMAVLVGVDRARFRRETPPGTLLTARVKLTYDTPRLAVFDGALSCPDGPVAEGMVRLGLSPFPNAAARDGAASVLRRVGCAEATGQSATSGAPT